MTQFAEYIQHGWKICAIPPGTKGPRTTGWSEQKNAITNPEGLVGAGLLHAYSGTCSLDLDRMDEAAAYLVQHGIVLADLLADPAAVQIKSGRSNRGKLIYALATPLPSISLCGSPAAFELRCGTSKSTSVQDVLPPSIHPDTGKPYEWVGDWRNLPPIPDALLALWKSVLGSDIQQRDDRVLAQKSSNPEIVNFLSKRDPNCGYDEWIKIGMAIHDATGGSNDGFAIWDEWSATSHKYEGRQDLESHWLSFGRSDTPITIDSLRRGSKASVDDFEDVSQGLATLFESKPVEKMELDFRFLNLDELFKRPEPEWIIPGVLPEAAIGVIYGQHSAGKTFTAVDLALSISLGQSWRGQPVKQGSILYVAAEDDRGIQIRLAAGLAARGASAAPIKVLPTAPVLIDRAHQTALLKAIKREKRPSIIFFDTLAAVTPGADENSGKEMGELLGYCHKLYEATGAMIMLIHHEGKTDGRGPRGWSGMGGAFEIIWKVSADELKHELEIEKVKNAAKGDVFQFRLLPVANSCIVEWL
jgi:hypothetical protein